MKDCPSFYGFQAKGIGSDTARNICSKLSVIWPNHSKVFEHRMDTYMDPAYVVRLPIVPKNFSCSNMSPTMYNCISSYPTPSLTSNPVLHMEIQIFKQRDLNSRPPQNQSFYTMLGYQLFQAFETVWKLVEQCLLSYYMQTQPPKR